MVDAAGEQELRVTKVTADGSSVVEDCVTIEEPMEIRVVCGPQDNRTMRSLSVTMRTPGQDQQLAAGFLFTESILNSPAEIDSFQFRGVSETGEETGNIVRVELKPTVQLDLARLQRHFFTTSSCGVCGKASLEALSLQGVRPLPADDLQISSATIRGLPELLRNDQPTFARTGGIHAAGLFDDRGRVVASCEDVGRHNAVDKLIGEMFLAEKIPLSNHILVISGRASFEIMQKALVAGAPVVVAVGAPSSLAVNLAEQYHMTLIGFASAERFNIYAGAARVAIS